MKSLQEIQREIQTWAQKEFGENRSRDEHSPTHTHPLGSLAPLLGMMEELGELTHVVLYRHQGRGFSNPSLYRDKIEDSLGDLLIFLLDYASRERLDVLTVLNGVWEKVKKRHMRTWNEDKAKEKQGERIYKKVPCPDCNGEGEILTKSMKFNFATDRSLLRCPTCLGEGEVEVGITCPEKYHDGQQEGVE